MTKVLKKLPGVLSFQRCLMVSDGLFYNLFNDGTTSPLMVVRHGIRGTQNINKFGEKKTAAAGTVKREEVSNIQTTDTAKLDPQAQKLRVVFGVRFIDLDAALFSCAPGKTDTQDDLQLFREQLETFLEEAKKSTGLQELALRYARNIANGRFLWRNRVMAESVRVQVSLQGIGQGTGQGTGQSSENVEFDALSIPLTTFEEYSEHEQLLAQSILQGLQGKHKAALQVVADVDLGIQGGVEVFPSQNYLENKSKGFARPLYCVGNAPVQQDRDSTQERGQAALRDQKISNALRTIDTWYPEFAEHGLPLPVEPNGASLDAQRFFRNNKETSGFQYLLRVGSMEPDTEEGMFLLACIIRGGVFSGSE